MRISLMRLTTSLPLLSLLFICFFCQLAAAVHSTEREYRQAQLSFEKLLKDSHRQKDRYNWLVCIRKFRSVYTAQPQGPRADDALLAIGNLYSRLYKLSLRFEDKHEALDAYWRLLRRFPQSPYGSAAKKAIAKLNGHKKRTNHKETSTGFTVAETYKEKSASLTAIEKGVRGRKTSKPEGGLLAEVTNLRFWSSPSYTRVVIDMDREVSYTYHLLRKDPGIGKPQRLYIDLDHARTGANLKPIVPIGDDLLSDARAAQYASDTVRVVLDIKSIDDFKIFSLQNPFRVVLDVNGIPRKHPSKKLVKGGVEERGNNVPKGSLAKQLALGVKRIVIDPGHGGKDPGAIGYYDGVIEKNVTLEVSKRLAKKIREKLGCEVILTRDKDVFLSLEERTAIANMKNADIFISVHTNAHRNRRCRGVETYFLNLATDDDAIELAARENATSAKNISDLEVILNDLMKNAKINESSRLADHIQWAMVRKLKPKYKGIKDNGVKQAPFYVLLGADMPCVLVEIAFISNPTECRRLNTVTYQEEVATGIVRGLENYIDKIGPTAVLTNGAMTRAN